MIAVAIIFETRQDHIKVSVPFGYDESTEEYQDLDRKVVVVCIFFWLMGLIEFVIIFGGETLFNTQANLLMTFAHTASILALIDFKTRISHVNDLSVTVVLAGYVHFRA